MPDYTLLELQLQRYDAESYSATTTRRMGGDNQDNRREASSPLRFDFASLLAATADSDAYGRLLTEQLAAAPELREELAAARAGVAPVRLRISISTTAPRLHELRWETLRDPGNLDALLVTNENILFSRHVFVARATRLKAQRPAELKALVVIAAPTDLGEARTAGPPLAPIDRAEEDAAARRRLAGFTAKVLPAGTDLMGILDELRADEYDVLYVVCHGAVVRGDPCLILENEAGLRDTVLGMEIVRRVSDLRSAPSLVVLASCRSGGARFTSTGHLVASVGASLATEAGVPAVIAMQGDVTPETASAVLEKFFAHLQGHGEIDWAMAVARAEVNGRSDAWVPVLYMRLLDGRLWPLEREPGAPAIIGGAFKEWRDLLAHVRRGRCTPIVGFGVYEEMFGSATALAQRWAETYRYPFRQGDELPQIAQYLAVNHSPQYPRYELLDYLKREILRRSAAQGVKLTEGAPLDQLVTEAWKAKAAPSDPHRILAHLPCPLYLTTNMSRIVETALEDSGVKPVEAICRWNADIAETPLPAQIDDLHPLVYHLFGRFDHDESIVISEDHYFDYLVGTATAKGDLDKRVQGMVNNSALMLLGFQITEWSLRVLFRSIMTTEGRGRRRDFTHVAVQVDPGQVSSGELDRVREFLAGYFRKDDITIFPGTVADFSNQLVEQWNAAFGEDLVAGRARRV